jgi:hypothetical protein
VNAAPSERIVPSAVPACFVVVIGFPQTTQMIFLLRVSFRVKGRF